MYNNTVKAVCEDCSSEYIRCPNCSRWVTEEDYHEDEKCCTYCGIECSSCSTIFPFEGSERDCPECGETYYRCECCGEVTAEAMETLDGMVCEECVRNYYHECDECSELFHDRDGMFGELNHVCNRCARDYYYRRCEDCDEIYPEDNMEYVEDYGWVCRSCLDDYARCEGCGRYTDTYNEGGYCNRCAGEVIHDYYYKPTPVFYPAANPYALFLGVELEIDKGGYSHSKAKAIQEMSDCLYIKRDGSLRDGFEIVTHPCTLEYHQNYLPWEDILEKALDLGYYSHDTTTCGLHVHLSRKALGYTEEDQDLTLMKMLFFVERYWDQLVKFSRRTREAIRQWADRYGIDDDPEELLDVAKDSADGGGRYRAVNLCNQHTIELRLFRGTLKYNTFIATLQFCSELVRIASETDVDDIFYMNWDDFVSKISPEYEELHTYLKERNLVGGNE